MNLSDTLKMIAVLKAAYPHSFKDMSRAEADAMVNLWARVFKDDNPLEVSAAIDALISTRTVGYSPTPGEVKEQSPIPNPHPQSPCDKNFYNYQR